MATLQLNQLPVPTFAHIGVNGVSVTVPEFAASEAAIRLPAGVTLQTGAPGEHQASAIYDDLAQRSVPVQIISGSADEPVRIEIPADSAQHISVDIPDRKALTVIVSYPEAASISGVEIHIPAYAKCKLVQVFHGGEPVSDITAEIGEQAEFTLTQLWYGGVKAVSGVTANLNGYKGSFNAELGYLLTGNDTLDINLQAVHNGKKSQSEINVRGVLRDAASKIFRGTIDFKTGASGAKGAEREDVLLLDETVKNRTAPLILCAEEDVEGTHGATIGRLDRKSMFYLQSRGIPEETIRELMAQARLYSVVKTVGDAETEHAILKNLGRDDLDQAP